MHLGIVQLNIFPQFQQLSPRESGIMKALLHHGSRFMGNAMAACWHDPEGNSQSVIEYLVLTFVEVLLFCGKVPTATLWIQAGLESGICWYISTRSRTWCLIHWEVHLSVLTVTCDKEPSHGENSMAVDLKIFVTFFKLCIFFFNNPNRYEIHLN